MSIAPTWLEEVMGSLSPLHWIIVLGVIMLLFGTGKISSLMGDTAKGIKAFKKTMAENDDASMEATADKPTGTLSSPTPAAQATTAQTTAAHQG
jgi:sec-independent protein translocase protein TatA